MPVQNSSNNPIAVKISALVQFGLSAFFLIFAMAGISLALKVPQPTIFFLIMTLGAVLTFFISIIYARKSSIFELLDEKMELKQSISELSSFIQNKEQEILAIAQQNTKETVEKELSELMEITLKLENELYSMDE